MKIDQLRKIVAGLTEGPWKCWQESKYGYRLCISSTTANIFKHDADGIVAMRNHIEALLDIAEAAKYRQRKGHNHTCSYALSDKYECDCGQIRLREALEKLENINAI